MSATSDVTLFVLGPLRVERAGRDLDVGGPKERRVLGVLAAGVGDTVSIDEIVEALWVSPPRSAVRSVHALVAHLRKVLEPDRARGAAAGVLVTEGRGYRLAIDAGAVDTVRFERQARSAHDDLAAGNLIEARRALTDALSLWRGTPFDEHLDAERCAQDARRLEETRLLAVEDLTSVRLELGEAAELVSELEALVSRHPWRERLWANFMLALYRAGRQADALRTYQRAREALVEELGVEPGPELRQLEAAILDHDPVLLTSSRIRPATARRLPAALDPGATVLVGRDRE